MIIIFFELEQKKMSAGEYLTYFLTLPRIIKYKDNRQTCKCCNQKIGEYNPTPIYDKTPLKDWLKQEQLDLF